MHSLTPSNGSSGDRSPEENSSYRRQLGLPAIPFLDERLAPPVDASLLHGFKQGLLPPEQAEEVLDWIVAFRSWHEAYRQLILNCLSRSRGSHEPTDAGTLEA